MHPKNFWHHHHHRLFSVQECENLEFIFLFFIYFSPQEMWILIGRSKRNVKHFIDDKFLFHVKLIWFRRKSGVFMSLLLAIWHQCHTLFLIFSFFFLPVYMWASTLLYRCFCFLYIILKPAPIYGLDIDVEMVFTSMGFPNTRRIVSHRVNIHRIDFVLFTFIKIWYGRGESIRIRFILPKEII